MAGKKKAPPPPEPPPKRRRALKELDLDDPDDQAVDLVLNHRFSAPQALKYTKSTLTDNAVYQRVARHRERLAETAASSAAAVSADAQLKSPPGQLSSNAAGASTTSAHPSAPEVTPGTSVTKGNKRSSSKRRHGASQSALDQALARMPGWQDRGKIEANVTRRTKRPSADVQRDTFAGNAEKAHRHEKYKRVFKEATLQLDQYDKSGMKGKKGCGSYAVAKTYNEQLQSPEDMKLKPSTLQEAVREGRAGISPPKMGRPRTIPDALTTAVALQATAVQIAGQGEASKQKMHATIDAATTGTEWEGKVNRDSVWRAARERHPEMLNPATAVKSDDRRVDWLTATNINDWTDQTKAFLVDINMLSPVPGKICGVPSEVSLVHEDDAHWFNTTDETQQTLSNAPDNGGPQAQRWFNPTFGRSGDRIIESSSHTTGVYSTNLAGETLPPLYIFESRAQNEENFSVDISVLEGLPVVSGKYGGSIRRKHYSNVSIRKKGGMTTTLWEMFCEEICKLYPRMSRQVVRDPKTNKLISGPLILKTDAGPGRLASEAASFEFRKKMYDRGLLILLSIPNGTAATAEMDQLYRVFKGACKRSCFRVANIKLAARVAARKQAKADGAKAVSLEEDSDDEEEALQELFDEEGVEGSADPDTASPEETGIVPVEYKGSVCNVTLSNRDLAHIVNGYPGDPIEQRPFDYCFQPATVLKSWKDVGFLPMTRNALNNPKVRHEVTGDPEDEMSQRIELFFEDYRKAAADLQRAGFNAEALDIEPPEVEARDDITDDEEKLIQLIIKNKAINSAGKLFKLGIHIANCKVVLEAARRMKLLKEEAEQKKALKKAVESGSKEKNAVLAFQCWKAAGSKVIDGMPKFEKADDPKAIVKYLIPIVAPSETNISQYTSSAKKSVDRLVAVAGGTTWDAEMEKLEEKSAFGGGGVADPFATISTGAGDLF